MIYQKRIWSMKKEYDRWKKNMIEKISFTSRYSWISAALPQNTLDLSF